jgi:hypothetical protein
MLEMKLELALMWTKHRKGDLKKKALYSTRFGFLELYNRKEQQALLCPSGYSISQCFNVLTKMMSE